MGPGGVDSASLLSALFLGFPLSSGLSPLYWEPPSLRAAHLSCHIAAICCISRVRIVSNEIHLLPASSAKHSVGTSVPLTSSVPCPLPSHVSCPKALLTLPSQCICHFGISGATIQVQVSLRVYPLQHPPEGLLPFSHFNWPHTLPQDSF